MAGTDPGARGRLVSSTKSTSLEPDSPHRVLGPCPRRVEHTGQSLGSKPCPGQHLSLLLVSLVIGGTEGSPSLLPSCLSANWMQQLRHRGVKPRTPSQEMTEQELAQTPRALGPRGDPSDGDGKSGGGQRLSLNPSSILSGPEKYKGPHRVHYPAPPCRSGD